MDALVEQNVTKSVKPATIHIHAVYSCENCHYAIEVIKYEVETLRPCPCCECVEWYCQLIEQSRVNSAKHILI